MCSQKKTQAYILQQLGQATLEYVLLILVVLSIFLGAILAISESTSRFAQNYFGEYLACLLETGELPRLDSDENPNTECDDSFQPFTLAGGRPFELSDPTSSSQSSDQAAPESDRGSTSEAQDSSSRENEDLAPQSIAADGIAGGQFNENFSRRRRVPVGLQNRNKAADRADILGQRNSLSVSNEGESIDDGRPTLIPITFGGAQQDVEDESNKKIELSEVEQGPQDNRPKVIPINKLAERSVQSEKDDGISFGDFLRYLVIIIIVVAIIIVIGGQIYQFQKGRE